MTQEVLDFGSDQDGLDQGGFVKGGAAGSAQPLALPGADGNSLEPGWGAPWGIDASWEAVLAPALEENAARIAAGVGADILPEASQVFRAFRQPRDNVRVIIVGQDPYPTPGHAMGLAFSTAPGIPAPRSLRNIHTEMVADLGVEAAGELADGNLEAWEHQGVLLLNRVLTVAPGQAGSHRGLGWEAVTEAALRALDVPGRVAVLWGRQAQGCAKFIPRVPQVCSAHPSPLSARRGFFGSRPFSRVNELLRDQAAAPVDWRL